MLVRLRAGRASLKRLTSLGRRSAGDPDCSPGQIDRGRLLGTLAYSLRGWKLVQLINIRSIHQRIRNGIRLARRDMRAPDQQEYNRLGCASSNCLRRRYGHHQQTERPWHDGQGRSQCYLDPNLF